MLASTATDPENASAAGWQAELRTAFKSLDELLAYLQLDRASAAVYAPAADEFPLLVPRGFAARMKKGDPRDPLLRQVLPLAAERRAVPGFERDPLRELDAARDGVIRKYPGRALLIATAACPVHCRYCFRRHFPYSDHTAARAEWHAAIDTLEHDTGIAEVVLSGGDPLSLSNARLAGLLARLEPIEHLTTLRIHSRYPIIVPQRVDSEILELIRNTRLRVVVVVHCNHPAEIDTAVDTALGALGGSGACVLNQSVLLRDVNDDLGVLEALSWRLFRAGALPYYLHELDRVAGTAHFDVSRRRARELVEALRKRVPGYLVPRLVREIPGELSKTVVG